MNFIFNCPETGEVFETGDFSLTENEGTATAPDGSKVLKAVVVLNAPCPICGQRHRYRAEDLACPFRRT
jgi:predicted RNA-binding Zn-ribbon protein involved in translation (DUF1610 family)